MEERGFSDHGDGADEPSAWLGDHAHDAWTDEDEGQGADDVQDDAGPASTGDEGRDTGPEAGLEVGDHADPPPEETGTEAPDEDWAGPEDERWARPEDEGWARPEDEDWAEPEDDPRRAAWWWLSPAFFAGALAGMLVVALVWLLAAAGSEGESGGPANAAASRTDPAPSQGTASAPTTAPTTAATMSDEQRREEQCAEAAATLQGALRAAAPALDQWEVHVDAMNQLVTGAITLQQATQFWNQTRVGAHQRLARFRAADRGLDDPAGACPAGDEQDADPAALRSCARVVAHDREALDAARTSIDTWEHHVHDMEMLRSGRLSPTAATQMWLASWKQGVRELDAYHATLRGPEPQRCSG